MANRTRLLAAGVAAMALVGTANAQTTTTTTTTTTTQVVKGSMFLNSNVAIEGGATVGRITDFVLSDDGCVEYVVVDSNNQYVLVPFQVVHFDPGRHVVQVGITQQKWRDIPTFTGTNWPVHDENYLSKVRTTFGVRESGYRGDRDRRPMDRGNTPGDRRDDRTQPPQRRDVETPNRPVPKPPVTPPEPGRTPAENRPPRTLPPPPPGTPGTNPTQPERDRPPV